MKPLLLALVMSTGCITVTHAVATSKKPDACSPFAAIAADMVVGMAGTYGGLLYDKPVLTASGGVYLGLSTLIAFAQMGECGWSR